MMDKDTRQSIKDSIKNILVENFSNKNKHQILEYEDRLNFACPYCGDSINSRKKRGNVYLDNLTFHCFNCGRHTNYIKFMHDFNQSIGIINLDTVSETIKTGKKKKHESFDIEIFDILENLSFSRKELKTKFRLSEILEGSKIYEYLKSRCLQNKTTNFLYNSYHDELWVLNFTKSGKICGCQIRSFNPDKVKYRTYNISKLYQYSDKEFPEYDEETIIVLNQISMTFNILNVNLFDNLYIFEGGIDSMFLPNSIGICGVGRNFDLVESLSNTMYMFDNDNPGFLKTKEKLCQGKRVFMWKKLLNDLNISEYIKDFNDLIIYMVKNKIKFNFNNMSEYFTNEQLDLIEI